MPWGTAKKPLAEAKVLLLRQRAGLCTCRLPSPSPDTVIAKDRQVDSPWPTGRQQLRLPGSVAVASTTRRSTTAMAGATCFLLCLSATQVRMLPAYPETRDGQVRGVTHQDGENTLNNRGGDKLNQGLSST